MEQRETQPEVPWRVRDLAGEERLDDDRPVCPRCGGAGLVREWSAFFFAQTMVGFGLGLYCAFRALAAPDVRYAFGPLAFFMLCVGVFGLFMLIDRGECATCSGMGRLEADDEESDADDAEWAAHAPPE